VRIVVTRVAGDGGVRRGVLDSADGGGTGRYEELLQQAVLAGLPAYRPVSGAPVYEIRTEDGAILVAEGDLTGPLRELVIAALAG
jgi:hypothetical protein